MTIITCPGCSKEKKHAARGYCATCYHRLVYVPKHKEEILERTRQYSREHYARHREAKLADQRKRYKANPEHKLAMNRDWYRRNKERRRVTAARWEANNKDRMRFLHNRKNLKRRSHLRLAVNTFTHDQWIAIKAAYGGRCAYCRKKSARMTQDHVVPISKGGAHAADNIVPSCRSCNSQKGAKAPLAPINLVLTA